MFAQFEAHFHRDVELSCCENNSHVKQSIDNPQIRELLLHFGGASFNNGLYKIMVENNMKTMQEFVVQAFPNFINRISGFAYDWLGRIFALDHARQEGGSSAVVMLEPGTGQALEIPCNLTTFHNSELIHYAEEALATTFYKQWLLKGGVAPHYDQCVGYKKMLFLGGKDAVENLEQSDLDVYWTLCGQLIRKTRGLRGSSGRE